jgi:FkbM family methyltransferase
MPPSVASYIYTVLLKPRPLRLLAHRIICGIIPAEIELRGVHIVLNQKDAIVSGNLMLGCYETSNLDIFESLLEPGMCVLDIGANIGLYSAVAAQRIGPTGRVIAVEPGAENCSFIKRTAERNSFNNIELIQKAAGARSESAFLYLCSTNKADHRIYDQSHERERVPVEIEPVDLMLEKLGTPHVDVIKMDTQGAEPFVFDGMKQLLQKNRRLKIMMEFWPWGIRQAGRDPAELLETIREHGFSVSEIHDDRKGMTPLHNFSPILELNLERQHTDLYLERSV